VRPSRVELKCTISLVEGGFLFQVLASKFRLDCVDRNRVITASVMVPMAPTVSEWRAVVGAVPARKCVPSFCSKMLNLVAWFVQTYRPNISIGIIDAPEMTLTRI
jgi:hypothetical protein